MLALFALAPAPATACGWDSDTVVTDARYMRDVLAVVVGRFPRNPPLYYEMRLARAGRQIEQHKGDLAAYDDAGVASDKLGRSDEAIAWMERKRAQLDALDAASSERKEHLYRYLANQGTFYVHRWVRQGAPRDRLGDVEKSLALLREAIRVNPEAHFGREKYQVQAVQWLLTPPPSLERLVIRNEAVPEHVAVLQLVPGYLGPTRINGPIFPADGLRGDVRELPPIEAVRGLAGLVALGSAWESADVFHNLAIVLRFGAERHDALSAIASLRAKELVTAGRHTLFPKPPADEASAVGYPESSYNFGGKSWDEIQQGIGKIDKASYRKLAGRTFLEKQFHLLRREAEAWNDARNAYLLARLKRGEHPDTHPDFWSGFEEPRPALLDRVRADKKQDLLVEFERPR